MTIFVVNVANQAYCEVEIEDQPMKASANLISRIEMHSGFGISIPTLVLYLQDTSGTLQTEMNLIEGIKCTLSLARDGVRDRRVKRSFRLWSISRTVTSDGPLIKVIFIMDVPKWGTSVYCESFRTTSDGVMQSLAGKAGLRYDGPENSTNDEMPWLNFHTTRANFSEDVAMRGYAGNTSCMVRVLTFDSVLKYKDLFHLMTKEPIATLAHNTLAEGKKKPIIAIRETEEVAAGGLMTHWLNYGQVQYNHRLDKSGTLVIDGMDVPVFGQALPINEKVRSALDSPARVNYVGFDPGTAPGQDFNVHKEYERALYQNLRGIGVFSERLRVLTTQFTELSEFDVIDYVQKDAAGTIDIDSVSNNGKYIIVGKTLVIKDGHNYCEVFDIVRPYVYTGKASKKGTAESGAQKVKANAGNNTMAAERAAELNSPTPVNTVQPPETPLKQERTPKADQINKLTSGLKSFNEAVPAVPATPLAGPGSLNQNSPSVVAQRDLAAAIDDVKRNGGDLQNAIAVSPDAFNPERSYTVKKISAASVELSANETIQTVLENEGKTAETANKVNKAVGLNGVSPSKLKELSVPVEKQVLDRFTVDSGPDPLLSIKKESIKSAVSATTSNNLQVGSFVTDPLRGGVFDQDYIDRGAVPPVIEDLKNVDAAEHIKSKGTNFLFPASKFGLSASDALISPRRAIEYAEDFVEEAKDPVRFLRDKGSQVYMDTFGDRPPEDARDVVDSIRNRLPDLREAFGDNEIIAGNPLTTALESGFKQVAGGVLKFGAAVGIEPDVDVSSYQISGAIEDGINGVKNDTGFSKIFNFRFGDSGVGPLLEKVVNKERIDSDDGIEAATDVIEMNRDTVSWQNFTRMGSNNSLVHSEQNPSEPQPDSGNGYPDADFKHWSYPESSSMATFVEGKGKAYSFPSSKVLK